MKILVAESTGFSEKAASVLRSLGAVSFCDLDRAELLAKVQETDVLWVRLRHQINAEVFDSACKLQYLVSPTTGLNHIDVPAARDKGVQVLCLKNHVEFLRDIRATAEHTIALMLSLIRNIPSAVQDVRSGNWTRDRHKGSEIFGKTVGILGYGRVGRIVARYLDVFDAKVIVCDPLVAESELDGRENVSIVELFKRSDIVTIHVDLNERTERLVSYNELQHVREGAVLINTSRGELIDEAALLSLVRSGRVSGVALDVLTGEGLKEFQSSDLMLEARQNKRILVTPHIGGCTSESMERTEEYMAQVLYAAVSQDS